MGVVFEARQVSLDRRVALKMIRTGLQAGDEEIARFRTEAEAAAQLKHSNIVQIYEVGTHAGQPYVSLELVEHGSLGRRLGIAPLAPPEAAWLVRTLAQAVHQAHARGIVHRDLKPDNVLLAETADDVEDGRDVVALGSLRPITKYVPKITDFGLAKRLDRDSNQTRTGAIIGTPSYMAPEQAEASATVGPPCDVYALGAILYEALTGRPPFRGATPFETVQQVLSQEPVAPGRLRPKVPRDLETICLKCLEKGALQRYPSAAVLAEELDRYLRGEPILARPPGLAERVWRTAKKHKGLVATAATILVLLVGAVWMASKAASEASQRAEANGRRTRLFEAKPEDLPAVIDALQPYMERVGADVRAVLDSPPNEANREQRIRAAMALLPSDHRHADFLGRQLLTCDEDFVMPLVRCLADDSADLQRAFWSDVLQPRDQPEQEQSEWIRRAAALANWNSASNRWKTVAPDVVECLVSQESFLVARVWLDAFRPVSDHLSDDLLRYYAQSTDLENRATAAQLIANWYAADAEALARFAVLADAGHYDLIADSLLDASLRDAAAGYLEQWLDDDALQDDRSNPAQVQPPDRAAVAERHAKRTANAVAVLCQLHGPDVLLPYLKWRPDPQVRSFLIHRLTPEMFDPEAVLERLGMQGDASVRRALLLLLGEYLTEPTGAELTNAVFALYASDPDPGVHSAAQWCLRTWGLDERIVRFVEMESARYEGDRIDKDWYINRQGHTMAVIPPGRFEMGSPRDEPNRRDWEAEPTPREIPYTFSMSTTEVTRAQLERFYPAHNSDRWWSREPTCPAGHVTWLLAAAYCNYLSELEGLPESEWCYDADNPGVIDPSYLTKTGYRLPTEAEWEYACRGGTVTSRYFGATDELLPEYAWYAQSPAVSRPVGLLKPNDFGLFDMYGNAWEWCSSFIPGDLQEGGAAEAIDYIPHGRSLYEMTAVIRSETVEDGAANMRSAMRSAMGTTPQDHTSATGFRVARTEATAP